ncbi:hypothetical protein NP511_09505 [Natrinema thermotolerans]|uniref:Uncharacterized protein n=1 Tax=Natrinema thermotolerans TaxID=121872 RepID=A0AAF0PE42_9EURY|nr:hypothetical protein [Natrinema thermotolerans]WMT09847.1 hypothetical protein NP511_09505 [Natrinema thermotolerans]
MNRRTLLTSISVGAATVAGCTGGVENDETGRKYEECNLPALQYGTLPEDVRAEVDTAFNEGQYETDGELLWQQVAGPGVEFLKKGGPWYTPDGTYYTPQVDSDNGVHTLQFEETTPQLDSTKYLHVEDVPEVPVNITIKYTDGTVLEDHTIEEKDDYPEVPVSNKVGTYLVEVTVKDWGTVTEEFGIDHFTQELNFGIHRESESSFSVSIQDNPATYPASCPWE